MNPSQTAGLAIVAGVLILVGALAVGAVIILGIPALLVIGTGLAYRDRKMTGLARAVLLLVAAVVLWLTLPDLGRGSVPIWLLVAGSILAIVAALLVRPTSADIPPPAS